MKFTESLASRVVTLIIGAAALGLGASLPAQIPGKAEVRAIKGSATYTPPGGVSAPLKVGTVLYSGSTIKTGSGSIVDLFMGKSAGFVRVVENTTLVLDKLAFTETGADTVVETQLNLPEGTILGNVNKLSAASKYEVKVPNGVAGIRGTRFRISSSGYVVLLDGSLIMVYVPTPGGTPIPYPLFGPPAQYFSPTEGVKPAPPDLITEVKNQGGPGFGGPGGGPPGTPGGPGPNPIKDNLPFIPPKPNSETTPSNNQPPSNPPSQPPAG
jgi:hypothetical protein